jgi:hypothetical protein
VYCLDGVKLVRMEFIWSVLLLGRDMEYRKGLTPYADRMALLSLARSWTPLSRSSYGEIQREWENLFLEDTPIEVFLIFCIFSASSSYVTVLRTVKECCDARQHLCSLSHLVNPKTIDQTRPIAKFFAAPLPDHASDFALAEDSPHIPD